MTSDPIKHTSPPTLEKLDELSSAVITPAHAERMALLFERYHGKLVKSLAPKTRSWDEARDIAAQAFAELLALDKPGTVSFLGAYLYRTARNLAANRFRNQAVRRKKEPIVGYEPIRASLSPEPEWTDLERLDILRRAIEHLTPRCRMALVLRVWHELSYDEIVARFAAAGVVLNVRTIERYVAQAIDQCRNELQAAEAPCSRGGA